MKKAILLLCCAMACSLLMLFVVPGVFSQSEGSESTSLAETADEVVLDRSDEIYDLLPDEEYGPLVNIALVQLEMLQPQDPEQHIADAFAAIDVAGQQGADLIVLPEGVNLGSGSQVHYWDIAVSIHSALLLRVGEKAAEYGCYIVFPFIELDNEKVYNSAAMFDRNGDCMGVYKKTHEPRCVILDNNVSLGDEFPVFETDFGRIGIVICYDTITPEPAMIYGLKGVDILVYPHMIQPLENEYFHITTRAKAFDSSLYIAAAGWARPFEEAGGPLAATCLIDWEGQVLAQGSKLYPGIVYYEFRPQRPRITEWLGVIEKAEWRKVLWGERRPHIYGLLTEDNDEWRAWCPSEER